MIQGEARSRALLEEKRMDAEVLAVRAMNERDELEAHRWAGIASGLQTAIKLLWG